jgi:hypothetical protein
MELTDSEREEFNRLANDTFDPGIWLDDDLPLLRAIKREHEDAREPESEVLPGEQPNMTEDDQGTGADTGATDDE